MRCFQLWIGQALCLIRMHNLRCYPGRVGSGGPAREDLAAGGVWEGIHWPRAALLSCCSRRDVNLGGQGLLARLDA